MYATIRMFCMLISMNYVTYVEIQFNSSRPNPRRREKIKLNFYFNTTFRNAWGVKSLWFKTSQLHKFVRNGGKNLGPSQDGFFSIKLTKNKKNNKDEMSCTFPVMTSLMLNSKLCNFTTSWNLNKPP